SAGIADFSLRIEPPLTQSVSQGGSATYKVFTVPNSLMSSATSLTFSTEGLPPESTAVFLPSNAVLVGTRVNLTITTSPAFGVGVGSFLVFVKAVPASARAREFPVSLTVTAGTDFALSLSPSPTVSQDAGPANFTVTATSSGNFSSTVTLNYSYIPSGSTANFSSSTIVPKPSGATTTFRVYVNSSTALGTKLFTICGGGGPPQRSHCIQGSVTVTASTTPSFTLSISPSTQTVSQNSSTSYTVTVGSTNGFSSQVSLVLSGNPTGTTGAFSTSPVTPPSNGNAQSTLTITTSTAPLYGTYNLTVTGTSPSYPLKSARTTLIVRLFNEPDFALYALPKTLSVVKNNSGIATIQVVSINSFTGSVALSLQNLPSGVTYSIVNPSVTPLEGGYVYTKLTLQTSGSTLLGDYDLTIRGTSGSKTHTVALGLQVINKSSPLPFKCIIATATYGSEMSPEVQYLRGFRDGRILTTLAGTEFMKVFNAWYYSFSPYIASWITDNPASQGPAKVVIMPLLGILHLSETAYSVLGFAPETAVTLAGVIASFLIGMLYFGPILAFAYRLLDQDRFRKVLACGALTLAGSLILLTISLSALLPTLVMLASSILVLSTVTLGSCSTYMLTSRILSKIRLVG
ncbi:MAG: hypothetical protein NTX81_03295, partial [Candidatus Bathyarchaeota archaeon]|nr:hypothetical protein [Candidatus Bathyarchaeota archaeon]